MDRNYDNGDFHVTDSDYGKFDPVNHQHVLSDSKRHEGRDRSLTREKDHRSSVNRSLRAAWKKESKKAGADLPMFDAKRVGEPQALRNLTRKKAEEVANGDPWALRDVPKPGEPKTHRQSVELAVETVKERERLGVENDADAVIKVRQHNEVQALMSKDPHYAQHSKAYGVLDREMQRLTQPKANQMTWLSPKMRRTLEPSWDGRSPPNPKAVSPAAYRKVLEQVQRNLPRVMPLIARAQAGYPVQLAALWAEMDR